MRSKKEAESSPPVHQLSHLLSVPRGPFRISAEEGGSSAFPSVNIAFLHVLDGIGASKKFKTYVLLNLNYFLFGLITDTSIVIFLFFSCCLCTLWKLHYGLNRLF